MLSEFFLSENAADVCCLVDVENQLLCKYTLKEDDLTKLRDAIEDLYYFEFVIGKILCLFLP